MFWRVLDQLLMKTKMTILSLQILTAGRKMFLRMQLQNFLKILANYMRWSKSACHNLFSFYNFLHFEFKKGTLCFGGLLLLLASYSCLIFFVLYGRFYHLFSQSLITSFIKVDLCFDSIHKSEVFLPINYLS